MALSCEGALRGVWGLFYIPIFQHKIPSWGTVQSLDVVDNYESFLNSFQHIHFDVQCRTRFRNHTTMKLKCGFTIGDEEDWLDSYWNTEIVREGKNGKKGWKGRGRARNRDFGQGMSDFLLRSYIHPIGLA